jgi:hypothetical protein
MVYGVKQPSPLSSLPLGGYSIGQISRALVSVSVPLAVNLGLQDSEFIICRFLLHLPNGALDASKSSLLYSHLPRTSTTD